MTLQENLNAQEERRPTYAELLDAVISLSDGVLSCPEDIMYSTGLAREDAERVFRICGEAVVRFQKYGLK